MKVLNFGSLNLDLTYQVEHMVRPGETAAAEVRCTFPGGKGLNQSVALARAGAEVYHAGNIGPDGALLTDTLREAGADVSLVRVADEVSGHAVIQVDRQGENAILLYHGANFAVTEAQIEAVLSRFGPGDWLVLQNEVNRLDALLRAGAQRRMTVVLNPSPMDSGILDLPLELVDLFLLNALEGEALSGESAPESMLDVLAQRYPRAEAVLTLGSHGCLYRAGEVRLSQPSFPVRAVDTTGAGDTFTGYFLAARIRGLPVQDALRIAARAAAIAVSRPGAAPAIPTWDEVMAAERGGL